MVGRGKRDSRRPDVKSTREEEGEEHLALKSWLSALRTDLISEEGGRPARL
jgi:hypothetical protein